MSIPGQDAVNRFLENEVRLDDFLNDSESYTDKNSNAVESLPHLTARVDSMTLNITDKGAWSTGVTYNKNDIILENGTSYICILAHISGTFTADLNANKWTLYLNILKSELASSSEITKGDALIGVKQNFTNSQFTNQNILNNSQASILGFMTPDQYNNWLSSPATYDMSVIVQNAINSGCAIKLVPGNYYFTKSLTFINSGGLIGDKVNVNFNFNLAPIAVGNLVTKKTYTIATAGNTDWASVGASVVNSTALVPGKRYVIKEVGTTNWVSLGASSNTIGIIFVAINSGEGTGKAWIANFIATETGSLNNTGSVVGDCIEIIPTDQLQSGHYIISGINFQTSGSFPVSIIANTNGLNATIEHCHFGSDIKVEHCIDNRSAYGITVSNCNFHIARGVAIRLRDNGTLAPSYMYSYSSKILNCDITACAIGVEIEKTNAGPISIRDTIIEGGYLGVVCNTAIGGGFTWNLILDGVYFESIANCVLDLTANKTNVSTDISNVILIGCSFTASPSPAIRLGGYGRVEIHSTQTADSPIVSGTGQSYCFFYNSPKFVKSGTFGFAQQTQSTKYNPAVVGLGESPTSIVFYSTSGRSCHVQGYLQASSSPTAAIGFSLPIPPDLTLDPSLYGVTDPILGTALALLNGGNNAFIGVCVWEMASSQVRILGTSSPVQLWGASSSVPGTWGTSGIVKIDLTYFF